MESLILIADYQNPQHAEDLGVLLDSYARDPAGINTPLPASIRKNLAAELAKIPSAFSILCYVDGTPAGFANCFLGFSTFKCLPLVNIHDLAVHPNYRGRGIAGRLLARIEEEARAKGCCKVTLEVLDQNHAAKAAYLKSGFTGYELDPSLGKALFWEKPL